MDRGNAESIRIALQVIDGAPPEFVLSQPDFAVQVIEKCRRVDAKLGESAEYVLVGNSLTGSFNRAPGQPSPRYVSLKERSEAMRDRFPAGSPGKRLFTRMRDIAVEMLTRERLDDDQMGFE